MFLHMLSVDHRFKMETIWPSRSMHLLWLMVLLLLLLSLPPSGGQFQRDPNQPDTMHNSHQKNPSHSSSFTEEDFSASMLFSNTFCKFIFNGPEEDDDDNDDGGNPPEVPKRTRRSTIISEPNAQTSHLQSSSILLSLHNNRHHHHLDLTNTTNNNDNNNQTSLTNQQTKQMPSQTSNNNRFKKETPNIDNQPTVVNSGRSSELVFDTNFDMMYNDDPKTASAIGGLVEDQHKPNIQPDPSSFRRKKKSKNKKNHYNHYSYSPPSDGHPVYIGLEIIDVDRINDAENYFSLQLYLFEMWHEPRLNTTALKEYWARNSDPIPVLEANIADCLWTPSLVFEDATEKEHLLPPTNILLAHHNKVLLRKSRYSLKVRCHMNLQIYPMDKHYCHFKLRAFTDPIRKVVLKWLSDPKSPKPNLLDTEYNKTVIFNQDFAPSLFDIRVDNATHINITWLNETYSLLDVTFIFERRIIHSLLTVYIPSSLIVTLSWLQFWFDVEAVPGRMSLGIMSTLTIMTQILTNYEKAGNHVTAVDIWLFVCLIMVFLALMEYALAYTISHYYDNDDDYLDVYNNNINPSNCEFDSQTTIDAKTPNTKVEKQQNLCNNITTNNPLSTNMAPQTPSSPPPHPLLSSPPQSPNLNQVDPLSLPEVTNIEQVDPRALKDINNPDLNKENDNSQQMALVPKSNNNGSSCQSDPAVTDRILMAQQKILLASQELELLLNEEYNKTVGVIHTVRQTILDAQKIHSNLLGSSGPMKFDGNNNQNQNMYIHQRRPMASVPSSTTGTYNRSLSCPGYPRKPVGGHPAEPPNRLMRFRQSLRRQMSSRSLKASGYRGAPGGAGQSTGTGSCDLGPVIPVSGRSKLSEVDYCSRYLFPFAFVLFATGYWIALIYYKLRP